MRLARSAGPWQEFVKGLETEQVDGHGGWPGPERSASAMRGPLRMASDDHIRPTQQSIETRIFLWFWHLRKHRNHAFE